MKVLFYAGEEIPDQELVHGLDALLLPGRGALRRLLGELLGTLYEVPPFRSCVGDRVSCVLGTARRTVFRRRDPLSRGDDRGGDGAPRLDVEAVACALRFLGGPDIVLACQPLGYCSGAVVRLVAMADELGIPVKVVPISGVADDA